MTSTTDPTVPAPTVVTDDDDDDDDQAPPAPPRPTAGPAAPPAATSSQPISSSTPTTTSVSSGAPNSNIPGDDPGSGDRGLSTGESAGIGVGVAILVILLLIGAWFCVRRRRLRSRKLRSASLSSTAKDVTPDIEAASKEMGPDVRVYRDPGVPEMSPEFGVYGARAIPEMGADTASGRRISELASPVTPVEAFGDRQFAVELPGSEVPAKVPKKKDGERLFDDSPIDDPNDRDGSDARIFGSKSRGL